MRTSTPGTAGPTEPAFVPPSGLTVSTGAVCTVTVLVVTAGAVTVVPVTALVPVAPAVNVNVRFRGLLDVNLGCDQASFFDFAN